jgi:hypothetical protein
LMYFQSVAMKDVAKQNPALPTIFKLEEITSSLVGFFVLKYCKMVHPTDHEVILLSPQSFKHKKLFNFLKSF